MQEEKGRFRAGGRHQVEGIVFGRWDPCRHIDIQRAESPREEAEDPEGVWGREQVPEQKRDRFWWVGTVTQLHGPSLVASSSFLSEEEGGRLQSLRRMVKFGDISCGKWEKEPIKDFQEILEDFIQ